MFSLRDNSSIYQLPYYLTLLSWKSVSWDLIRSLNSPQLLVYDFPWKFRIFPSSPKKGNFKSVRLLFDCFFTTGIFRFLDEGSDVEECNDGLTGLGNTEHRLYAIKNSMRGWKLKLAYIIFLQYRMFLYYKYVRNCQGQRGHHCTFWLQIRDQRQEIPRWWKNQPNRSRTLL